MYCQYCGKEIPEGGACNCAASMFAGKETMGATTTQEAPERDKNFDQSRPEPNYNQVNDYRNAPDYLNEYRPAKSKLAAGLLHLLLGGVGVGNFYMGNIGLGILDVIFCWTGIPGIVGFIRGILILCMSDDEFEVKYNCKVLK